MIWQTGCHDVTVIDNGKMAEITLTFKASAEDRKKILQEIADNKLINRMY